MKIRYIKVSDLEDPELVLYHSLNEAQLKHFFEPVREGLFVAETPVVIERALAAGYEPYSFLTEPGYTGWLDSLCAGHADGAEVPAYIAEAEVLRKITGYKLTRGALCAMHRKPPLKLEDVTNGAERIAVLENVMNPTNAGAIFRSAAALGIDAVIMTGASTDPLYRRCVRVSMGTVFSMPWIRLEKEDTAAQMAYRLREDGFCCAAMALRDDSVPPDDAGIIKNDKIAVFLGTEEAGLCEETIGACDATVMIPMEKGVDSLNVSVAAGIAFWSIRKR